ncbi:MAG: hypothetical protein CM1200mP28_13130 [Deltaproteobacteria bacterium]|nr:MAG: hypothetical protein CM1200mP28_13130 [Deltaproteobacteria bacterium]
MLWQEKFVMAQNNLLKTGNDTKKTIRPYDERKKSKTLSKVSQKCFQEFSAGSLTLRVCGFELIIVQSIENGHSSFPRRI